MSNIAERKRDPVTDTPTLEKVWRKARNSPTYFAKKVLGVKLTGEQQLVLESLVKADKIAIKSGHAMGKDFTGAIIILWYLFTHHNSLVIATAPSSRQIEGVVFKEIYKLVNNSKLPLCDKRCLLSKDIKLSPEWYATGFTTKETNQTIGRFQGFHGKDVLVCITEAQAVEDTIFDQIETLLTGDNAKLYLAGNPLRSQGKFYDAFEDDEFTTFTFSCYDSPNYKTGKEIFPGMATRKWVERQEKKLGKESPEFQARVLGNFPKVSIDSLLSLEQCRQAVDNKDCQKGLKVLGIDPARFGLDSTAVYLLQGGKVLYSNAYQGKPTTETEGLILNLINEHEPDIIVIDEGAMGGGIVDHINEKAKEVEDEQGINIDLYNFNFGGKAMDSEKYSNRGTEIWFEGANKIIKGQVSLDKKDVDLMKDLTNRRYEFTSRGQMRMESKQKMRSRGIKSPDRADAFLMALSLSTEEHFDLTPEGEAESTDYTWLERDFNEKTGLPISEVLV